MKAELRRLPYLDSARGIAALSVITWHCYTTITNHPENTSLYTSPFHFFLYGEADMIFFLFKVFYEQNICKLTRREEVVFE